jgi:hypothetical protein
MVLTENNVMHAMLVPATHSIKRVESAIRNATSLEERDDDTVEGK